MKKEGKDTFMSMRLQSFWAHPFSRSLKIIEVIFLIRAIWKTTSETNKQGDLWFSDFQSVELEVSHEHLFIRPLRVVVGVILGQM